MLYVDKRDGSVELIVPLTKRGLPVKSGIWPADLFWLGRGDKGASVSIGIEFKKLPDLLQSLRDGRLTGVQLPTMQEADIDFKYLFVEGVIRIDKKGRLLKRIGRYREDWRPYPGMGAAEMFKRVERLQRVWGLMPRWFDTRTTTLFAIEMLYHSWTDKDPEESSSAIAIHRPRPVIPISGQRELLCRLPGISIKGSRAAMQHFGSVRNAINAGPAAWAALETIAEDGKARRIGDAAGQKIEQFVTDITREVSRVRKTKR